MKYLAMVTVTMVASTLAAAAQARPVIVVDPGHGGPEAGVESSGVLEKDMVLRAGFVLAEELVIRGFDVRLTRSGDEQVSIDERMAMAEEVGAALFISLHFNGDEDVLAHGIEIYTNLSVDLAASAAQAMATALEDTGGPVVVENRTWGFVSSPDIPTVMIEAGFLTHPVERRLIVSRAHHRDLARMMADGVDAFINSRN